MISNNKEIIIENGTHKTENHQNVYENYRIIDLRSDTFTLPTQEMRIAMAEAEVGDDQYGEDPSVNRLQERSAKLFGMDAALFVPSGTMANLIALMAHCRYRGMEAICGDLSHVFGYEQGGAAYLAGVQLCPIKNKSDGTFCLKEFKEKIRNTDVHKPVTGLAIVENTHNFCGGKIMPLDWLNEFVEIGKMHSLKLHMDGARIFHAAETLQVPLSRIVKGFDSVCYCLSKGLSAPVGSILIGSTSFIKEAVRLRQALGGGMRQAGVLAAAGLVALDTIVPKLGADHKRLRRIATAVYNANSPNVTVDLNSVETNVMLLKIINTEKLTSAEFQKRLCTVTMDEIAHEITEEHGLGIIIKTYCIDVCTPRMIVYHYITDSDVDATIKKLLYCIKEFDKNI